MSRRSDGISGEYAPGAQVPGTQYRIVRLLGSGGHGSVYAVEHVFLRAPFVLKVLHAENVEDGDLAQRMMREARTLANLRHPNIVQVHDGGLTAERPPRPFFVMEALQGMPLRELLREMNELGAGVGAVHALRIAVGILSGLGYAHESGVIHRDVKPDNVFLHKSTDAITTAKILDFGIAHLLMGKRLTGRHFIGTPRYASPEQLRGDPISPQSDIYSAGLVLWELLTGEVPYAQHRDMAAIVGAHLHEPLPRPSLRCREVTPALDDLVASMLAKDPRDRPQKASAAAFALREARETLEAVRARSIHSPDFRTEPTPMENVLTERSPEDSRVMTEVGAPSGGAVNDTIPDPAPVFETIREDLKAARDPALATTDRAAKEEASFDRGAKTNTAPARPAERTDAMSAESLRRGLSDVDREAARPDPGGPLHVTPLTSISRTRPEAIAAPLSRSPWRTSLLISASIIGVSLVLAVAIATVGRRNADVAREPALAASTAMATPEASTTVATNAPSPPLGSAATEAAPATSATASSPPPSSNVVPARRAQPASPARAPAAPPSDTIAAPDRTL